MTHPFIGTWRSEANPNAFLTFSADHNLHGSDGINRLVTTWSEEGEVAFVQPALTTMMATQNLQAWVTRVRSVDIRDNELVVFDAQSKELGTLQKSE